MDKKKILLTIAIPTYNRINCIRKQINSILPQLTEETKLVIYDNHSDVPVKDLFNDRELEKMTIFRHDVNIGGDANIARCFEKCDTNWLWTLSDDDYVKEGAVEKVLYYIKHNQDSVFINMWSNKECTTYKSNDFLNYLSDVETFTSAFAMSACIYNMSILKPYIYYYYKNLSSMLGTLIMLTRNIIDNDGSCLWVNDSPVEMNKDVGWNYKDFINRSFLFIDEFSDKDKNKYKKNIFLGLYKTDYVLIFINRLSSNLKLKEQYLLFYKVLSYQGLFNALRYCPKEVIKCFLKLIIRLFLK